MLLSSFPIFIHLILTKTLWRKHCFYSIFISFHRWENWGIKKLRPLSKITDLITSRTRNPSLTDQGQQSCLLFSIFQTAIWEINSVFCFLKRKKALFRGASEAVGRFRMKLNISFPATGCQKLIEVDDERKLHTLYEKVWPQKLLLTLWVKNGRVMWSKSVAGTISRVSPWSRVSWPMAEFACYWVRGIPVTDQGGLERESANLYGVALWMPIWVFSIWSSWKKERRIFLDSLIL